jgi:hypothetical protein
MAQKTKGPERPKGPVDPVKRAMGRPRNGLDQIGPTPGSKIIKKASQHEARGTRARVTRICGLASRDPEDPDPPSKREQGDGGQLATGQTETNSSRTTRVAGEGSRWRVWAGLARGNGCEGAHHSTGQSTSRCDWGSCCFSAVGRPCVDGRFDALVSERRAAFLFFAARQLL